ncbi:MAG: hypothetical protein KA519_10810 [Bacteroides sp.]|nr:hypothetical protein [Bacteroides sp.]
MNKIIYNLIFNRKKSLNEKGVALVLIEAYLRGKRKYFSTSIYLRPDQWNNKMRLIKNHPNAEALNRMVYGHVAFIENKELELWQRGNYLTISLYILIMKRFR